MIYKSVFLILFIASLFACERDKATADKSNNLFGNDSVEINNIKNYSSIRIDNLGIIVKLATNSKIDSVYKYLYINSHSCGSKRVKVLSLENNKTFFPDTLPQIYSPKYDREEAIEVIEKTFCNLKENIIDYIKMFYKCENGIKHTKLNEKWDAYSVFSSYEKDNYVLNENTTFITDGEIIFLIKYKSTTKCKTEISKAIDFILKNIIIKNV